MTDGKASKANGVAKKQDASLRQYVDSDGHFSLVRLVEWRFESISNELANIGRVHIETFGLQTLLP